MCWGATRFYNNCTKIFEGLFPDRSALEIVEGGKEEVVAGFERHDMMAFGMKLKKLPFSTYAFCDEP